MKLKSIFLTALVFISILAEAQVENNTLFPTPNAASLGIYGQIPVDLFNGQPDISIPLFNFKSRDLAVPLALHYHSGGIKPSDHASWVGLGWSLEAGGVITRIQNDLPDEFVNYAYADPNTHDISMVKNGFFYNVGLLGDNNWTTTVYQNELICRYEQATVVTDLSCDPQHRKDKAPDEFAFNFMGMSGSLFLGNNGQWQIKTKQGLHFTVKFDIGPYTVIEPTTSATVPRGSTIKSCITDFILTAADGTQYFFGGAPNAIEFARVGVGTGYQDTRDGGTVPTSWYLTKIQSVNNDEIDFSYTRDGYQIMNYPSGQAYTYQCASCTPSMFYTGGPLAALADQLSILDGVTLSSITGANGSVQFNKSKANVLDFSVNNSLEIPQNTGNIFQAYAAEVFGTLGNGLDYGVTGTHSTFMKLNQIAILGTNGSPLMDFNFSYLENANNRLFLNSLTQTAPDGTGLPPYTFVYNNISALANVPYETSMTDHWGYFTGRDPLVGLTFYNNGFSLVYQPGQLLYSASGTYYLPQAFDNTFSTTYTNNRAPNTTTMQYGVLTQINFPTGGNTHFNWENNRFSKCIDQTPTMTSLNIAVKDLASENPGPGLRIQQIISTPNSTSPSVTKTYLYYRDYTGNSYTSSGILNSGLPKYVDTYASTGNFTYYVWSTNNRVPMHYTNGGPITYTNVVEQNADGGYTAYNYANHDNGYADKVPDRYFVLDAGNTAYQDLNTNSLELERGLLLSSKQYSTGSNLLRSTTFLYNDDPNRYQTSVKRYLLDNKFSLNGTILNFQADPGTNPASPGPPIYTGFNFYAMSAYTFYPFLKTKTVSEYNQTGANPVVTTTNFTYDNLRNKLTESRITSKGETIANQFNYSSNGISGLSNAAIAGQTAAYNAGMLGVPMETITTNNGTETDRSRLDFQTYTNSSNLIVPGNSWQASYGVALEAGTQYLNYDSKGNILEYITRKGLPTSFDWAYNQSYPVVKVENAANTLHTLNQATNVNVTNNFSWSTGQNQQQYASFAVSTVGTITLTAAGSVNPGNVVVNYQYSLVGPANESGFLCISTGGTGCGVNSSTVSFPNMPIGNYSLTVSPSQNTSIGYSLGYTFPSTTYTPTLTGIKEYFYEGFEENVNGTPGVAHTGLRYYSGNYTTTFTPPNGRNYLVQWWTLVSGAWVFHQQTYTANMVLAGPVDDVRIFPADAQMNSYTYTPLFGITSQTDPNGKTTYYEYDPLQRLLNVKDFQGNIVKNFQYNYLKSCGRICQIFRLRNLIGRNIISYPVGVFNLRKHFIGNATNQAQFITIWMSDTTDSHTGTLTPDADSLQFDLNLNAGRTMPDNITGARYYQYDLAYNTLDAISNFNGCFVDFGDGTQMQLGNSPLDTVGLMLPANTAMTYAPFTLYNYGARYGNYPFFIHTYPNSNLKTITIYHNDASEEPGLYYTSSNASLQHLTNVRGNFPQYMQVFQNNGYTTASSQTVANVYNWSTIHSILYFSQGTNYGYAQDFMQYNPGITTFSYPTSALLHLMKSNWNTFFFRIQSLYMTTSTWNHENLSALTALNWFELECDIPVTPSQLDSIYIQIAAGSAQYLTAGSIFVDIPVTVYNTSASYAATAFLRSKGWYLRISESQPF